MNTPRTSCESCLMPFAKDHGPQESDRYCSLCFQNGALCYQGTDLKEFQRRCSRAMIEKGRHPLVATLSTFIIRFAPRWKT